MNTIKRMLAVVLLGALTSFAHGDDFPSRYHTYQEVLDTLTSLEALYPEIIYVDTMGYSERDSVPMLRVKLSDNPQVDEDEPAVFYNGGVHADEVLGVEVVMCFLYDIISRYAQSDPEAIDFIQELEIFVVPIINPDGHIIVEAGDLIWRKNTSDNDNNGIFDIHDGVDNNRNYDFGWSIDDELDAVTPESLMFKGFAPFTESENVAMAQFGWKYRPVIALDHHSPTYGRPNVAYYPWYWYSTEGGHGYSPDEDLMQSICEQYTSRIMAIPDDSGTVTYTARRALVNKGDFKTYFYGNFGTAAFSVEISDTTLQNPALADSIVEAHLPGLYWLLGRALGSGITGVIRDSLTLDFLEAEVQVLQHINDDINPRLSRPDNGRYNRLMDPGTYDLRFIKDGYRTKTVYNVVVGSTQPAVTNVLLSPLNPVPGTPALVSPADESTVNNEYIYFGWNHASGATGYVIEIANDEMFSNIFEYDSTVVGASYMNTNALTDGDYYWRCTAYNGFGYSGVSDIWHFTVALSQIPESPTLLYPVGATVDTSLLSFDWTDETGAEGYVFQLSYDSEFNNLVEFDSTLAISQYQNSTPLGNGTYYWRVCSYNTHGYSEVSSANFTVSIPGPVPVLLSPGEGFTSHSAYVNFDWEDISDTAVYLIEIASDLTFDSIVEFDSMLVSSSYTNADSLLNGTYYWRVKAMDYMYWGDYCVPWEFYVDVDTGSVFYIPGDCNGDGRVVGSDVTFLVNYFRGMTIPPIEVNGFYPGADSNGDCRNTGSDVTYLVNYFRGYSAPIDGHCF